MSLMPRPILYDLTQFLRAPFRTGIQRVVFEISRNWSGQRPLVPALVGADSRLRVLPARTLELIARFFLAAPDQVHALREHLASLLHDKGASRPARLRHYAAILNPEVFFEPSHLSFYERLLARGHGGRVFLIFYDLLPLWHPEWFDRHIGLVSMEYLHLVRRVANVAFISESVRGEYLDRLLRRPQPTGPVICLGADGLGMAEPCFDPTVRRFTVVGTIEPRKNHAAVLDVFETLWAEGVDAELVFAGRMVNLYPEIAERVRRVQTIQPRFHWQEAPDDDSLRALIRGSRATIYSSLAEGFGLPPLESLALGVPVIVSESIPSVAMLKPLGQVRVPEPTADWLCRAVRPMCDDTFAARKFEEIRRLRLPRWSELGPQVERWMAAELEGRSANDPATRQSHFAGAGHIA
jgi:glycosyltransferase involved in cell wall biosynthesis